MTTATVDDVVAWVDGRPVTSSEVARRLALIRDEVAEVAMPAPGSPEDRRLRRWVVQTLVDERLLARGGRLLGVTVEPSPGHPPADEDVVAVFEALVADVVVDDREVREHYERNLGRYRVPERRRVDLLVVEAAEDARRYGTAARGRGLRATVERSPACAVERRELTRGAVGGELEDAVFAAEPPSLVGPIATPAGWHVVEVLAVLPATVVPLDDVADAIRTDLLATARGTRFDRWLAAARRDHARFTPGNEHPGDPRLPDSIHRH